MITVWMGKQFTQWCRLSEFIRWKRNPCERLYSRETILLENAKFEETEPIGGLTLQRIPPSLDLTEIRNILTRHLPDLSQDNGDSQALLWLLQTSTDPEIILSAINIIPRIQWLPHLNYTPLLNQMSSKLGPFGSEAMPYLDSKELCIWMKGFVHLGLLFRDGTGYHPTDPPWPLDILLDTYPYAGDIAIITYLQKGKTQFPQIEPLLPSCDFLWISHILPFFVREHRVNRVVLCHIIGKCLRDPSHRIRANGFLSVLLLSGLSIDPVFYWILDKSEALFELRKNVLMHIPHILSKEQLDDKPELSLLIPPIILCFLETCHLLGEAYVRNNSWEYETVQSYGVDIFKYFMSKEKTELALWGLCLLVSQPHGQLGHWRPAAVPLKLSQFDVMALLPFVMRPSANEEVLVSALFGISISEEWDDNDDDYVLYIQGILSVLQKSKSASVKHFSILALKTLSTIRPVEGILDLPICIDISNALVDLFKYDPDEWVSVEDTLEPDTFEPDTFEPRISMNRDLRFPSLEYLKILSRLLECEKWIPHFWNDGHYINCVRLPISRYYNMAPSHRNEIIKLIRLGVLRMDNDSSPAGFQTRLDLLRRWEFMSSLKILFPRVNRSKITNFYILPDYYPELETVEFQTCLLRLIILTVTYLQTSVDTNQFQSFIEDLLKFMPRHKLDLEEFMNPEEDGTTAGIHDNSELQEINQGRSPVSEDKGLQNLWLRLTTLTICHLRWDPKFQYARKLDAHIQLCLAILPDGDYITTGMLEWRPILSELRKLVPMAP
ncbi:hypothetical protein M422DRAFT_45274 [Sphaerobolus stellatus SS14]|nr:hypothetical protein M422DRAFT_45274 [Sphaerobolus stellatus SS14]